MLKRTLLILFSSVFILLLVKSVIQVKVNELGVVWKPFWGGTVTDEPLLKKGLHIVAPWNSVVIYDISDQYFFKEIDVLCSNRVDVILGIGVNYQPQTDSLVFLHRLKGEDYVHVVILPELQLQTIDIIKKYIPEQIYSSQREVIQKEIFDSVKVSLDKQYIQLNSVLIQDVILPESIKEALVRGINKEEQELVEYIYVFEKEEKQLEIDNYNNNERDTVETAKMIRMRNALKKILQQP